MHHAQASQHFLKSCLFYVFFWYLAVNMDKLGCLLLSRSFSCLFSKRLQWTILATVSLFFSLWCVTSALSPTNQSSSPSSNLPSVQFDDILEKHHCALHRLNVRTHDNIFQWFSAAGTVLKGVTMSGFPWYASIKNLVTNSCIGSWWKIFLIIK